MADTFVILEQYFEINVFEKSNHHCLPTDLDVKTKISFKIKMKGLHRPSKDNYLIHSRVKKSQ